MQPVVVNLMLLESFPQRPLLELLHGLGHDEVAPCAMLCMHVINVALKDVCTCQAQLLYDLVLAGKGGQVHTRPVLGAALLIQIEGLQRLSLFVAILILRSFDSVVPIDDGTDRLVLPLPDGQVDRRPLVIVEKVHLRSFLQQFVKYYTAIFRIL